jgi:hypothetical protein
MKIFPLQAFDWDRGDRLLFEEASTLGMDKIDQEIAIRSHHTGRVVKFTATSAQRDDEGETLFWEWRNYNEDLTVRVWND